MTANTRFDTQSYTQPYMGDLHFVVRSLPATGIGIDGAFRVHVPPGSMQQLNLKLGDVCSLTGEDGVQGLGIAWQAADKLSSSPKNPPVKMTETLREAWGFKQGTQIKVEKSRQKICQADNVALIDVTPDDYQSVDDGHWRNRCTNTLDSSEAFTLGMTFDVSAKKGLKRRFFVEHVASSEAPSAGPALYFLNDKTEVRILDAPLASQSPRSSQPERDVHIDTTGIGGLAEQIQKLNTRLQRLCLRARFQNTSPDYPFNEAVLVHGYEGTGKTLLLNELAKSPRFRKVVRLEHNQLLSTASKNDASIRNAFNDAFLNQPSLVLIDDLDQIAPANDAATASIARSLASSFDFISSTSVLVVGAARVPSNVDRALLASGRFDALIELPIPDQKARSQILGALLAGKGVDQATCDHVAARTHGFTGDDVARLVRNALSRTLDRYQEEQDDWVDIHSPGIPPVPSSPTPASRTLDRDTDGTVHSQATTIVENNSVPPAEEAPRLTTTLADFEAVLPFVRPTALREIILETPKVSWSDIGGSAAMKTRFDRIIEWPHQRPDIFTTFGVNPKQKGVLLYGPPGCSKTMTAQAVASTYRHNFIAVKGAELISMYVGESERAVREVFRKARAAAPCIIFFDEIDAIASSRSGGDGGASKGLNVLTTLLNEMDGFESLRGVLVLAATNAPHTLDPALLRPGRFDSHFYVGPPDADARIEILRLCTKNTPLAEDIDLNALAYDMEGYSGAETVRVCELAVMEAVAEAFEITVTENVAKPVKSTVSVKDFDEGLKQVKRGISQEMLKTYEDFGKGRI